MSKAISPQCGHLHAAPQCSPSKAAPQGKEHPLTEAAETPQFAMKASFHLQLSGLHQPISRKSFSLREKSGEGKWNNQVSGSMFHVPGFLLLSHTSPRDVSDSLRQHLGEMPIAALGVKALNPVVQSGIDCAVVKKYALLRCAAPKPQALRFSLRLSAAAPGRDAHCGPRR